MNSPFNNRRVSQERVLGFSFVDILIQAVFVLLVALMVGYVDPLEKLQLKDYAEAGKDLCQKLNKDSPVACREYVEGKAIGVVNGLEGVGPEICNRLKAANREQCLEALNNFIDKGSQATCLKAPSRNRVEFSMRWEIRTPDEMIFRGFTEPYLRYLREKQDHARLSTAESIQEKVPLQLKPAEVAKVFEFIREANCFHASSSYQTGKFNSDDVKEARLALEKLRAFQEK
jgi:hypothetical protein